MNKLSIAAVILLLAAPLAAQGPVNWDADLAGFFFDTHATQTTTNAVMGQSVTAYLVAFNLTFDPADAVSWEGGCYWPCVMDEPQLWPDFTNFQLFTLFAPGNVTLEFMDCGYGQSVSGTFVAPPSGPAVVLALMEIIVLTPNPIGIYDEMGGVRMMMSNGSERLLRSSTREISAMPPPLWLYATINSDHTPIDVQTSSWGAVKTMFR